MPPEVRELGRTLSTWRAQIFAYRQGRHSNGITEAMNDLIKRAKRVGYGFRNSGNYRTRVLLYASKPHWRTLSSITIPDPTRIRRASLSPLLDTKRRSGANYL